jgi:hypothetical protein
MRGGRPRPAPTPRGAVGAMRHECTAAGFFSTWPVAATQSPSGARLGGVVTPPHTPVALTPAGLLAWRQSLSRSQPPG